MQNFLTAAFNAIALFGIAYTAVSFGVFVMGKHRRTSPGQSELPLFPDNDLPDLDNLPPLAEIKAIAAEVLPTAIDLEPVDDLLSIPPTPAPVRLEWASIRQLKALASLYQVPRFNRLRKPDLVEVLQEAIAA